LTLASKAGALRHQRALGSWLYKVAYHIALRAKARAARRRTLEQQGAAMPLTDPVSEITWRELGPVLDEELQRLPEKLRAPLVLCYLQGKTNAEAAEQLGWAAGSISKRLAQGRELLRQRLGRRGFALATGPLAALLADNASAAVLPAKLADITARTAFVLAHGSGLTATTLPAGVGALLQETLRGMVIAKIKVAAAVILVVGLVGSGAGALAHRHYSTNPTGGETGVAAALVAAADPEPAPVKADEPPRIRQEISQGTALWSLSALPTRSDVKTWTEDNINHVVRLAEKSGQPILPSFFPMIANGKLVYRSYDGVYALDMKKEGKLYWYSYTDGGVLSLLSDPNKKSYFDQWNQVYRQKGPPVILQNSAIGALTSDNERMFLIDDLLLPPPPEQIEQVLGKKIGSFGTLGEAVSRNTLSAYSVVSGKLVWQYGRFDKDSELSSSFFLGPPLSLAGKLYLLNEKDGQLRLVCLMRLDTETEARPPDIVWVRDLLKLDEQLPLHLNRRIHAATPVAAGDTLVCPTYAGRVVAANRATGKLLWTHVYRKVNAVPESAALWSTPALFIHDGRVVFTAVDDPAVHCVKLSDGKPLWKADKDEDLYLAGVFGNAVLLVGKQHCRALRLSDGEPLWKTETGTPSGHGVALGRAYYLLPLQAEAKTGKAGISVISIKTGHVAAHAPARMRVPGNLLLSEDGLVSQTLREVTFYPPLTFTADPRDLSLRPKELQTLWAELDAASGVQLVNTMWTLSADGKSAVTLLRQKLRPVAQPDERAINRWIEDLKSDKAAVRQRAEHELEKYGELAEPALRRVLASKPTLDLHRRAEGLLDGIEQQRKSPPPTVVREIRAVQVLERVASADARRLLEELSQGAAGARLTKEAKAALERLNNAPPATSP
jgi:RNA polymerase sigma factor (sigma-70 family)